jgi:hypothetical protein
MAAPAGRVIVSTAGERSSSLGAPAATARALTPASPPVTSTPRRSSGPVAHPPAEPGHDRRDPARQEGSSLTDTTDTLAPAASSADPGPQRRGSGLAAQKLPELQQMAAGLGITGVARMRKSQLVEAIENAQAGPRPSAGAAATSAPAEPRERSARTGPADDDDGPQDRSEPSADRGESRFDDDDSGGRRRRRRGRDRYRDRDRDRDRDRRARRHGADGARASRGRRDAARRAPCAPWLRPWGSPRAGSRPC